MKFEVNWPSNLFKYTDVDCGLDRNNSETLLRLLVDCSDVID